MRSVSNVMSRAMLIAVVAFSISASADAFQLLNQAIRVDVQHHRGFERVTIATQSGRAVAEDHVFRVVSRNSYYGNNGTVYSKTLTIPQGQSSATIELYINDSTPGNWSANFLHVEQDGNERYDARDLLMTQANSRNYDYFGFPATLFISSSVSSIASETHICGGRTGTINAAVSVPVLSSVSVNNPLPSFFELEPLFVQSGELVQGAVTDSKSLLQSISSIESLMPTGLPRNWKGLIPYELAIISIEDLVAISKADDDIRTALKSWVSAGGSLVVFNCGKQFEKLPTILPLLTGQPSGAPTNKQVLWTVPGPAIQKLDRFAMDVDYYYGPNQPQITISRNEANLGEGDRFTPMPQDVEGAENVPFAVSGFVNGHIIAVPDDMQKWKLKDWQTLYNTQQAFDSRIDKTIGTSSLASTYDSGYSIPGVGRPPVIAFQVVISLFVLVVGPGLYIFLYQSGRMHLLLIIAPVLSLLACLGLFLYAIIHDGFDIRGRVQSVTRIDHQSGTAVTHARHAYYAGISPQGYAFDVQTAVFDARRDNSAATKFRYRDNDDLVVSGGELKARNPHQLVSVRSFQTEGRLSVNAMPGESPEIQKFQIENQFQSNIELAIVRARNQWLIAENIGAGAVVVANTATMREIKAKLMALVEEHSPMTSDRQQNAFSVWNPYDPDRQAGQSDLLIQNFRSGNLKTADIEDGGYIAVMQQFDEVPDPQPAAIYGQNQLHMVIGKW